MYSFITFCIHFLGNVLLDNILQSYISTCHNNITIYRYPILVLSE